MLKVLFFTTSVGYVIEVLRGDHLIDDARGMITDTSDEKIGDRACRHAFELAAKHEVPGSQVFYDVLGEHDEESLFA